MKPNLVWFDIPALDLERAIRFYSAVLGREIKQEVLGGVPTGMLPTADGGQRGGGEGFQAFGGWDHDLLRCEWSAEGSGGCGQGEWGDGAAGCSLDWRVWLSCGGAGFGGKLHCAACGDGGVSLTPFKQDESN